MNMALKRDISIFCADDVPFGLDGQLTTKKNMGIRQECQECHKPANLGMVCTILYHAYSLVNVYIPMENHHVPSENQL